MFVRNIPLRAPEGSEGGGAAPVAAAPAATPASETAAVATNAAPALGGTDLAKIIADAVGAALAPMRSEIVDMRRETRNKFAAAGTAPGAGAVSATPATQPQWGPSEQLAFRDTIEEAGISVNVEQRRILETLVKAEGGNLADPIAWVKSKAEAFGWRKAAATAAAAAAVTAAAPIVAPPAPVVPPVATGAPSNGGTPPDPGDLASIDPAVLASLPREERMKRYQLFRDRGPNVNPYAGDATRARLNGAGRK